MKVALVLCVVVAVVAHPNVHTSVKHLVSDLHNLEEERGTTCSGFAASASLNPDHKKVRPRLRDAACMTTGVRNFCGDFCFADTCGDFAKGNAHCELNPKTATEFCGTAADAQRKEKTPPANLGDFETFPECSRKCCLPTSTCTSYSCKKGSIENEAHSGDTCFVTTQEHPKSCQKHCCSPDTAVPEVDAPRVSRSSKVRCDKYAKSSRTCTAVRPGLESYECDKTITYTDKASAQYSCEDVCCAKTCGDVGYDPNPPAPRKRAGKKAAPAPKPAEGMCKLKPDTPVGTVCEPLSDTVRLEILFGPPGDEDDELLEFQDIIDETEKASIARTKASPCSECCQEAITCEAFGDGCGQNRKNKMDQTTCDRDGKAKGSCFQECCFNTVVPCEEVIPEIRKRGGYCPASTRRRGQTCGHSVIDQLLGKGRHLYKECVNDCCDDIRVTYEGDEEDYQDKLTTPVNCATYGAAMEDQVCPDPEVSQDFDQDFETDAEFPDILDECNDSDDEEEVIEGFHRCKADTCVLKGYGCRDTCCDIQRVCGEFAEEAQCQLKSDDMADDECIEEYCEEQCCRREITCQTFFDHFRGNFPEGKTPKRGAAIGPTPCVDEGGDDEEFADDACEQLCFDEAVSCEELIPQMEVMGAICDPKPKNAFCPIASADYRLSECVDVCCKSVRRTAQTCSQFTSSRDNKCCVEDEDEMQESLDDFEAYVAGAKAKRHAACPVAVPNTNEVATKCGGGYTCLDTCCQKPAPVIKRKGSDKPRPKRPWQQ